MASLDTKRVDWLYDHFQAITQSSDRLLAVFGILSLSVLSVWLSSEKAVEVAFIKVSVDRQVLLGGLLVSAAFVFVAFCGNYDLGEFTTRQIAAALQCEYEELWFIDTHPTFVDYAKFQRPEVASRSWLPARATAALLYPLILVGTLFVLSFIWGYESFLDTMRWIDTGLFFVAGCTLIVAWMRGFEYVRRRVKTFWQAERARCLKARA